MKSRIVKLLALSLVLSGCILDPTENPEVMGVFVTDANRNSMVPIELRSGDLHKSNARVECVEDDEDDCDIVAVGDE